MKGIYFIALTLSIGLGIESCKKRGSQLMPPATEAESSVLDQDESVDSVRTESFTEFYERFVKDSTFQVSRLKFPLEGFWAKDDQHVEWTIDNWTLIKVSAFEIDTTEFKVQTQMTDTLNYFRIFIPNSGFEFEMKFGLIDRKWYLIYCKDMFS